MLENLAMAIVRIVWLIWGNICHIIARYINNDMMLRLELETQFMTCMMLFHQADEVLPPETKQQAVKLGYLGLGVIGLLVSRGIIGLFFR